MACHCTIIPGKVFKKLAQDPRFSDHQRKTFLDAAALDQQLRNARKAQTKATAMLSGVSASVNLAATPIVSVYDCKNTQSLPGTPVAGPQNSTDATAKRTFTETSEMVRFLATAFGRNSIDGQGMSLLSSIHFGIGFNNAFWNGTQMTYGDGDGNIFVDFTSANDVIAHELAHGLTQFTTQLNYTNQAGGLNESCSDVFGSMFRQWRGNQTVAQADWLIGKEIMGPAATQQGYTCLRNMKNPADPHSLGGPQPIKFSQYKTGMDPHESSGIPNLAFYTAATAIGGKSWEKAGKIWYAALTQYAPSPNMKMSAFAKRTRAQAKALFPADPTVYSGVVAGWKKVGL